MSESKTGDIPHYMLPNFASILPEYSNSESDNIRQAFSTGNYSAIHTLPNDIRPDNVTRAKQDHMAGNRSSMSGKSVGTKQYRPSNGLFQEFEYIPSRYSLEGEMKTQNRLQDEAKRLDMGGKDFVCSSNSRRLKHEDLFEDKDYRYPYMGDPFDAAQDQLLRMKWVEDAKVLHGPFIPSGTQKPLEHPTRRLLPEIVANLHQVIAADWAEHRFSVLATEDDNVAVRFDLSTVESQRGLLAYMNVLCASHSVVLKYELKKVVEEWHTQPGDGFLYFLFRPPWAHHRVADAFFTLHPEERVPLSHTGGVPGGSGGGSPAGGGALGGGGALTGGGGTRS